MERKFAHDFSRVRIHADGQAAASAAAIGASAYAFGSDIVLGSRRPSSTSDVRLLTHELAHVVQQEGSTSLAPSGLSSPSDAAEIEATRTETGLHDERTQYQVAVGGESGAIIHRALPVAAEVLEIALTAVIVAQEQAAISQGGLAIARETASRFGSPPQPKKADYIRRIMHVSRTHPVLPNLEADIYIRWSGNDYGEIGGAYIWIDPSHTQFSKSTLTGSFTPLNDLPVAGADPRAWPMQWIYTGEFDPIGGGDYGFDGKFEINAFGGFRILEHMVSDHSIRWGGGPASDYVERGSDSIVATPPLPANTKVTIDGSAVGKSPNKKP